MTPRITPLSPISTHVPRAGDDLGPGQQHLNFSEKDIKKAVGIEGSGESFFLYTEAFAKISVFA